MLSGIQVPDGHTCDWVEKYVDRLYSNPHLFANTLIISGGPGTGKSVLARFILEYLEKRQIKVASYFFKKRSNEDSTPAREVTAAIRTLIYQLLYKDRKLYRCIQGYFRKQQRRKSPWDFPLLWEAFKETLSNERSKSTIILIDALDECEATTRDLFLDKLASNAQLSRRFLVTTQPFTDFSNYFPNYRPLNVNTMVEVREGVKTFIDDSVKILLERRKITEAIRDRVTTKMKEKAGNMFLWVSLIIGHLNNMESTTPRHILKELKSLPEDLIETYVQLFKRQLVDHKKAIKQKLPWILYSHRLLNLEELKYALAMQDCSANGEEDLESWCSTDIEGDLNRNFGTLVTFERYTSERHVRFFHDSLKDALLGTLQPPRRELIETCRDSEICCTSEAEHAEIGATCLKYLALPTFNIPVPSWYGYGFRRLLKENPFLEYAAQNWPFHARKAGDKNAKILAEFQKLAESKLNMELAFQTYVKTTAFGVPSGTPLLQKVLFMELEWLAMYLVNRGEDVHQLADENRHAVHRASGGGSLEFLAYLSQNSDVHLNVRDDCRQTGLHYAAQRGRLEVVKFLLEKGLPVSDPGRSGNTPLHFATWNGYEEVVKELLIGGADIVATDEFGRT